MYKIVGYYICEKLDIPNFLGIKGNELISVSGCFSGIHPDLSVFVSPAPRSAPAMV